MSLENTIDTFIEEANTSISNRKKKEKVILYAQGLRNKLKVSQIALDKLGQEIQQATNISDEIHFFHDSFWICWYWPLL